MAGVRILPPAHKFLKKIKDKQLYKDAIKAIQEDPSIGEDKNGDLEGVKGYDIYYNKTNYELAYTVEYVENEEGWQGAEWIFQQVRWSQVPFPL